MARRLFALWKDAPVDTDRVWLGYGTSLHAPGGQILDIIPDPTRVVTGAQYSLGPGHDLLMVPSAPRRPERWASASDLLPHLEVSSPDHHAVLRAFALLHWLADARYCMRCGAALSGGASDASRTCTHCAKIYFPRLDPTVVVLPVAGDRCLLVRRPSWVGGRWSTVAGYCEPGEGLEDAARREVVEEAGIVIDDLSYVGSQTWPAPSSFVAAFRASARPDKPSPQDPEIAEARWFSRDELDAEVASGKLRLSEPASLSRRLIEEFMLGVP